MDCLVKLYQLPVLDNADSKITYRRAMSYEKTQVLDWVKSHFTIAWSDECSAAFNQPVISCFIAVEDDQIIGFACYDCTQRNFFGPMGVANNSRKKGVGSCLLISTLHDMKSSGYAYAIIGDSGCEIGFYSNAVGAISIDNSTPGAYPDKLK